MRRSGDPVGRAEASSERVGELYHQLLRTATDAHEWAYAWRSELNQGGFPAVSFLMEEVVATGKCIGCAACVTICPTGVFDYADEQPIDARPDACVQCILCADVCPVLRPADKNLPDRLKLHSPMHDEGFGPYSYGIYARATDPEIVAHSQDGGLVSALLLHQMEAGRLQGAVLGDVSPDNNQVGRHKIARTRREVLECAASRYTYSPNTLALHEAREKDIKPIAVVGVPCQVNGVRLQQHSGIRMSMAAWYRENVTLVIGLFCSEAFTHESLDELGRILGVDPRRIANINIKGKVVVRLDSGEVLNVPLKRYREFARPACLYCVDYGAEAADISAGGVGLDGWTLTLVRTQAGHAALQAAIADGWIETRPLTDEPRGSHLLSTLAASKKANRPHPAQMPTLQEREALGHLDPKTFYTTGPGAPVSDGEPSKNASSRKSAS